MACDPIGPMRLDGGSDAGGTGGGAGGGVTGGGGGAGGGGGGPADGGSDGGSDGGTGWFLTPVGFDATATSTDFVSITGSAQDLWALRANGDLYHSTGGRFALIKSFGVSTVGVATIGTSVFVATARGALSCLSNCVSTPATWLSFQFSDSALSRAICVHGTDVWLIAEGSGGATVRYQGASGIWNRVGPDVVSYPSNCWSDGARFFIVGAEGVSVDGRFERIEGNLVQFFGGSTVAGETWAVGNDSRVAHRAPNGTWTVERVPGTQRPMLTVGGPSPDTVWALGAAYQPGSSGAARSGSEWKDLPRLPGFGEQSVVKAMVITGPNEFYLVGRDDQSGSIVRVTR